MGERSIGNFGIGSRNSRGDTLVGFAERNNLRFMNTFFCKRRNRKWTWKSPDGKTKNEIDFILSDNPGIVQDVEVLGKIRSSDHRMVRCKIRLDLKRERGKLVKSRKLSIISVRERTQEFKITLQNKLALLPEDKVSVDELNYNITKSQQSNSQQATESAVSVGEVELRKEPGKLSKQTKDLIAKRQNMKLSQTVNQTELAALSKLINRRKTKDIRAYNMAIIEETPSNGRA